MTLAEADPPRREDWRKITTEQVAPIIKAAGLPEPDQVDSLTISYRTPDGMHVRADIFRDNIDSRLKVHRLQWGVSDV